MVAETNVIRTVENVERHATTKQERRFLSEAEALVRYMCLVYQDEDKVHSMPEAEYQAIVNEVREQRETLRGSGHLIFSSPLEPVACATTIRVRHGKMSITDGPFAETKEQLGGFYVIEARDLNEAIRLASRMPPAKIGSIEIRPLQELGGRPRIAIADDAMLDEGDSDG